MKISYILQVECNDAIDPDKLAELGDDIVCLLEQQAAWREITGIASINIARIEKAVPD
jgi:hypothetical protein